MKYATQQTFFRVGTADQGNVLARFVGGDAAVLSGLMVGGEAIRGRAFAVDVPEAYRGKGRVIMFAEQPDLPLAEPRRVQHGLQLDPQLERSGNKVTRQRVPRSTIGPSRFATPPARSRDTASASGGCAATFGSTLNDAEPLASTVNVPPLIGGGAHDNPQLIDARHVERRQAFGLEHEPLGRLQKPPPCAFGASSWPFRSTLNQVGRAQHPDRRPERRCVAARRRPADRAATPICADACATMS